jgi:hypothetical protein
MRKSTEKTFFKKVEDWAKDNKFWSDIVKAIVLGTVGTFLVGILIDALKDRLNYSSEIAKSEVSFKTSIIREFTQQSYLFTSFAVRYKESRISDHKTDSLTQSQLRDKYDDYRAAENQLNLTVSDKEDSLKAEHISADMLLLITKRDYLMDNSTVNFDSVRNRIKITTNQIARNCMERLRKYPG